MEMAGAMAIVGIAMMGAMIIGIGWAAVRGFASRKGPKPRKARSVEMLDERYARGEIGTQEYEERRQAPDSRRR
jgi:putative membrane protein